MYVKELPEENHDTWKHFGIMINFVWKYNFNISSFFIFYCFLKQDIKIMKISNLYLSIRAGVVQLSAESILVQPVYL